jgi:chromosome segregation ATPase
MEEPGSQETPANSGPATAVELPLPEKKQRSWAARLFSTETRFGRFLRALGRALIVIIILVAVGAALVEFLRYQPLKKEIMALQTSATQTAADLQARQADLQRASQGLSSARGETKDIQTQLDTTAARLNVLRVQNQVLSARLALANKDTSGAQKALTAAEGYLKSLIPQVEKVDKDQSATLQALFTLAKNDLSRDPKLFNQDMDRLQSELDMVEKNLLK